MGIDDADQPMLRMFCAPTIANRFQTATQPAGRQTAGSRPFPFILPQIPWGSAAGAGAKPPDTLSPGRYASGRVNRYPRPARSIP
jgi:hypothetical protein